MPKYDIVIGLPSFNEADSIKYVTETVDHALHQYFPEKRSLLLNLDSNSSDNTQTIFLETDAKNDKISLNAGLPGKGHNLLKLFNFAKENDIQYICTFDTDLTSIEPEWINKVLTPLVDNSQDYIVPVYGRNKYEANTTNHFCYPLISVYMGTPIRQPYSGDFGLNLEVAKYLLEQEIFEPIYQYGIDIFMTFHAVGGGFRIKEQYLGKKIHKPSFPKMVPMFGQASSTIFKILNQYKDFKVTQGNFSPESFENRSGIDPFIRKPPEDQLVERRQTAFVMLENALNSESFIKKQLQGLNNLIAKTGSLSASEWSRFLFEVCDFCTKNTLSNEEYIKLGKDFTPFYLFRVLSYFDEIDSLPNDQVELIINEQVEELKELVYANK
jgi:glucosylglycerate synthase